MNQIRASLGIPLMSVRPRIGAETWLADPVQSLPLGNAAQLEGAEFMHG